MNYVPLTIFKAVLTRSGLTHRGFGLEDVPSIFIDRSTYHNCVPKVTGDPFDKQFLIITEDYFYFKRTSLIFYISPYVRQQSAF